MFEVVDGAEPLQEVGEFRSSVSQAGFAFLPKLSNDVMKCEVWVFFFYGNLLFTYLFY